MTNEERQLLTSAAKSLLLLQERVDALELALTEFVKGHSPAITWYRLRLWSDLIKLKGQPTGYLDKILSDPG